MTRLSCWFIRRDLTALVDHELSDDRTTTVRAHLAQCAACAALHRDIEASVARQRQLLPMLLETTDVAAEPMLRELRQRVRSEPEPVPVRQWFLQPTTLAAAATALLIIVTFFGVLEPVFISMGLEDPPEVVVEQPDMFRDYALFEHLEALENFESVRSVEPRRPIEGQPQG